MSTSPLPAPELASADLPPMPVETDIYILPDGRIVVADLPAELVEVLPRLGLVEPCEIPDHDSTDPTA